ncbi:hypothetical protein G6F68_016837 [Rhizopus microsporus]|nr:hypothetical protein G6F68_016837 [Rhizopus microsporus]
MTLWVLGLNHQTAPVELRERAAFADRRGSAAVHLQPHRAVRRGRFGAGAGPVAACPGRRPAGLPVPACRRRCGAPPVPGCHRAGFDGAGRTTDPGPGEGCLVDRA